MGIQTIPVLVGIVLGLLRGGGFALKSLRSIEKKGDYRVSRREQISRRVAEFSAVGVILLLLVWFMGAVLALQASLQAAYFFVSAMFGAQAILYVVWEARNGKRIYSEGSFAYRLYAVPEKRA